MLHRPRLLTGMAISAVTLFGISSCSGETPTTPPAPSTSVSPTASATVAPVGSVPVEFKATLTSVYKKLASVGPKGAQTFGVNVLSGTTKINNRSVTVRILGTVDYNLGNGPFGGFLELVWSDGTTIGMRQEGLASTESGSKTRQLAARLDVIAGSKAAANTDGTGEWSGHSSGSPGSSVSIAATLWLTGAPEALTGVAPNTTPVPSTSYNATIAP